MTRSFILFLPLLTSTFWLGEATECNNTESARVKLAWATTANSSACAPYVTQTEPISVNAPCSATECVAVVGAMAAELPNCTLNGTNKRIEIEQALTVCNETDLGIADSMDMSMDASLSDGSDDSSGSASELTALSLLSTILFSSGASSSESTETMVGSVARCSTAEEKRTWNLFVSTATSSECIEAAVVTGSGVEILAPCNSECVKVVEKLADKLPNCLYDSESVNKKADVMRQFDECNETLKPVSIMIFLDSSIEFPSSSSSASKSQSNVYSSSSRDAADNRSDNMSERGGDEDTKTSASPQLNGNLLLWVVLFIGIVASFAT